MTIQRQSKLGGFCPLVFLSICTIVLSLPSSVYADAFVYNWKSNHLQDQNRINKFNESNTGFGYESRWKQSPTLLSYGFFTDSYDKIQGYISWIDYYRRYRFDEFQLKLGVTKGFTTHSRVVNGFLPIPMITPTIELTINKQFSITTVYIPKFVAEYHTFGFQLKLHLEN